jgi:hypothetical protein
MKRLQHQHRMRLGLIALAVLQFAVGADHGVTAAGQTRSVATAALAIASAFHLTTLAAVGGTGDVIGVLVSFVGAHSGVR